MITGFSKRWRVPALGVLMIVIWLGPINQGKAAETGQQIFQSLCAACHTIGKGKLVGPDLAGVTSLREEGWLIRQIKEPDRLLVENDPIALQLLQEANNVPMVPLGLSDAQVEAVIAYLKSTEQQAIVAVGLPSQYMPTVLISILVLIGLTLIGLIAGNKKVDVS
jgi:mono/diheme cytochrome c family protein